MINKRVCGNKLNKKEQKLVGFNHSEDFAICFRSDSEVNIPELRMKENPLARDHLKFCGALQNAKGLVSRKDSVSKVIKMVAEHYSGAAIVVGSDLEIDIRIRDGNGEALYPRSSFVINLYRRCLYKGDVVLFIQSLSTKWKMKRRGKLERKRTVAGRVVKESYGEAKQQHTFTVEGDSKIAFALSFACEGSKPLQIEDFQTAERSKVLAEKHKRGAAAREKRKTKKARPADGGVNSRNHFLETIPS